MPDNKQNSKVAVMGDMESVLGFRAIGLEVVAPTRTEEARDMLRHMANNGYAIIYITEELASQLTEDIARYKDSPNPAIILIPSKNGSMGIGKAAVKSCVERAVGADIL